ncbi:DUF4861 domain-containing protein [Marinoscillum sp. MHG1-6]|uniref:DUF4861 domain-containing protein n=1 Tax=Marinoscillum sp. MHG1-6 TaxID=2959627 RepID=UPI0021579CFD|nr:DUF4861 domain-containing protein [Marinoscillum sp. MHG1-6]
MRKVKLFSFHSFSLLLLIVTACHPGGVHMIISVENELEFDRVDEIVQVSLSGVTEGKETDPGQLAVWDGEKQLVTQHVDTDMDGMVDAVLFPATVGANSTKQYEIRVRKDSLPEEKIDRCFSRFVPERTDDYAWENNRIAFRTFGPTAQSMMESGIEGGTLTSGIDCWLKRVEYPIIDKWYGKYSSGSGSYHEDDGEGLDNFHVGVSRGCGGIAVQGGSDYWVSKNFTSWKTHYSGPLKTAFTLGYDDWQADDRLIREGKNISLDYGSNLSHYITTIEGTDEISVGLTLNERDGELSVNEEHGWISYWQPHGDSELAMAVVAAPETFLTYNQFMSGEKDLSNIYVHIKVNDNKAEYYSGFAWKESGQFKSKKAWEAYLTSFAIKLKNPLKVNVR